LHRIHYHSNVTMTTKMMGNEDGMGSTGFKAVERRVTLCVGDPV
jgi:hypothetical protein